MARRWWLVCRLLLCAHAVSIGRSPSGRVAPLGRLRHLLHGHGPAHVYQKNTSIEFWAGDFSSGAGSISSPVRAEHLRNASEIILIGEDWGSKAATGMPRWLLLSILGIVTRELTSRDVREKLVPQLYESYEAQAKAKDVSAILRRSLDDRVTRVLATYGTRTMGGNGGLSGAIAQLVEEEVAELQRVVTSYDAVIENEVSTALMEVLELEVSDRFERGMQAAVAMNVTDSVDEISSLMQVADVNSDGRLSFDEVYNVVFGQPINPLLREFAEQWVVITTPELATSRWERWSSLFVAPWLGRLMRASQLARATAEYAEEYGETYAKAVLRQISRDYAPEKVRFPEAFRRLVGYAPPAELMETLPGLNDQEVLLPAQNVTGKTAALVEESSKIATDTVNEAIEIVSSRQKELNKVLAARTQQRLGLLPTGLAESGLQRPRNHRRRWQFWRRRDE